MEDIGENKKRSHLVVLYIGSGIVTIRYPLHVPPTSDEIMEAQNFAKKELNLAETPVAVNWLPLAD